MESHNHADEASMVVDGKWAMHSRTFRRSPGRRGRAVSATTEDSLLSPDDPAAGPDVKEGQADPEYVRSLYANTRQWYTTAERKAQLLLTVNGAFVTIVFSTLFSRNNEVRAATANFGTDTRVFLGISAATLASAIACAGLSLWSLHGKGGREFAILGINPIDPDTYQPAGAMVFRTYSPTEARYCRQRALQGGPKVRNRGSCA
jgi:hypothetical protein